MAKTQTTTPRKAQPRNRTGLNAARLAHVHFRDAGKIIRAAIAERITVGWEMPNGEFLEAAFTGPQLLEVAAERGMLTETTSSKRRVPTGIAAAVRVIGGAA